MEHHADDVEQHPFGHVQTGNPSDGLSTVYGPWDDTISDWGTLTNWNSGQPVTALVSATGQLTSIGTQTLSTPRLPGASGTGPTSGQYDTVIFERPTADITVTLSTGTDNTRKLYVRE